MKHMKYLFLGMASMVLLPPALANALFALVALGGVLVYVGRREFPSFETMSYGEPLAVDPPLWLLAAGR